MVEAAPLSLPVEVPPVAAPPVAVAIDSVVTDGAADLRHQALGPLPAVLQHRRGERGPERRLLALSLLLLGEPMEM